MAASSEHTLIDQQRKALQAFVQANAARKTRETEITDQAQKKQAVLESEYKSLSQRNQGKLADTQAMLTLSGTAKTVLGGVTAAPLLTLPNPIDKNAQAEFEQAVGEAVTQSHEMKTAIANLDSYHAAEAKRQREEAEAAERRRLQKEAQRSKLKGFLKTVGWLTAVVAVAAGLRLAGLGMMIFGLLLVHIAFCIMVTIKMFQKKATGHGVLSILSIFFIYGLYPFIWGWWNANRLGMRNIMLSWTVFVVVMLLLFMSNPR